jgi:hypothetical protein
MSAFKTHHIFIDACSVGFSPDGLHSPDGMYRQANRERESVSHDGSVHKRGLLGLF